MAEYCTVEDIGRLGVNAQALEDVPSEDGQLPAIQAASDEVDSYLSKRYTLPLVAWGKKLREVTAVLAAWFIVGTEGIKPGENPEDNVLVMRVKEARAWLKMVADGTVDAGVTPTPDPGGAAAPGAPMVLSNRSRGWQDDTGGMASGLPFAGRRR